MNYFSTLILLFAYIFSEKNIPFVIFPLCAKTFTFLLIYYLFLVYLVGSLSPIFRWSKENTWRYASLWMSFNLKISVSWICQSISKILSKMWIYLWKCVETYSITRRKMYNLRALGTNSSLKTEYHSAFV